MSLNVLAAVVDEPTLKVVGRVALGGHVDGIALILGSIVVTIEDLVGAAEDLGVLRMLVFADIRHVIHLEDHGVIGDGSVSAVKSGGARLDVCLNIGELHSVRDIINGIIRFVGNPPAEDFRTAECDLVAGIAKDILQLFVRVGLLDIRRLDRASLAVEGDRQKRNDFLDHDIDGEGRRGEGDGVAVMDRTIFAGHAGQGAIALHVIDVDLVGDAGKAAVRQGDGNRLRLIIFLGGFGIGIDCDIEGSNGPLHRGFGGGGRTARLHGRIALEHAAAELRGLLLGKEAGVLASIHRNRIHRAFRGQKTGNGNIVTLELGFVDLEFLSGLLLDDGLLSGGLVGHFLVGVLGGEITCLGLGQSTTHSRRLGRLLNFFLGLLGHFGSGLLGGLLLDDRLLSGLLLDDGLLSGLLLDDGLLGGLLLDDRLLSGFLLDHGLLGGLLLDDGFLRHFRGGGLLNDGLLDHGHLGHFGSGLIGDGLLCHFGGGGLLDHGHLGHFGSGGLLGGSGSGLLSGGFLSGLSSGGPLLHGLHEGRRVHQGDADGVLGQGDGVALQELAVQRTIRADRDEPKVRIALVGLAQPHGDVCTFGGVGHDPAGDGPARLVLRRVVDDARAIIDAHERVVIRDVDLRSGGRCFSLGLLSLRRLLSLGRFFIIIGRNFLSRLLLCGRFRIGRRLSSCFIRSRLSFLFVFLNSFHHFLGFLRREFLVATGKSGGGNQAEDHEKCHGQGSDSLDQRSH